jgi:Lar family restriction alleviation protein
MSEAIKPCPFCGGEAYFSVGKIVDGRDWHYVECVQCGAIGPDVKYADHNIAVKSANALAWNTRTPDPRLEALTEQLEAACADAKEAETYAEELKNLLCLADETIMDLNGCFPLGHDQREHELRKACLAIRAVTGNDYDERKRCVRAALAEIEGEKG